MDKDAPLIATRAFTRELNLLLKSVRLYGTEHDRTTTLFESAWKGLRAALESAGDTGLLLGVSRSQVLLDGVPLEPKPTDQSFAHLLSSAGLSSIYFSPRVTAEDFSDFVRAFASADRKTTSLAGHLKAALARPGEPTIRINELRFVAQDAALADATVAGQLAVQSLGAEADKLKAWLQSPQKLLQLIAAAEGARSGPLDLRSTSAGPEAVTPPAREEDVMSIFGLLSRLGQAADQPDTQAQ